MNPASFNPQGDKSPNNARRGAGKEPVKLPAGDSQSLSDTGKIDFGKIDSSKIIDLLRTLYRQPPDAKTLQSVLQLALAGQRGELSTEHLAFLTAMCRTFASSHYRISSVIKATALLFSFSPTQEQLSAATTRLEKVRGLSAHQETALLKAFEILKPAFTDFDSCLFLVEAAEKNITPSFLQNALKVTNPWIDSNVETSNEVTSATKARLAYLGFAIRHGVSWSKDERKALAALRPNLATDIGNQSRALLFSAKYAASKPSVLEISAVLRTIAEFEVSNTSASADFKLILEHLAYSGGAQTFITREFQRVQASLRRSRILLGATLVQQGYSIGWLPLKSLYHLHHHHQRLQNEGKDPRQLKEISHGMSAFCERVLQPDHQASIYQTTNALDLIFGFSEKRNPIDGSSEDIYKSHAAAVLDDPNTGYKLAIVLSGRNLPKQQRLSSFPELTLFIHELRAQLLILQSLHTTNPVEREKLDERIVSSAIAAGDNPPFSIKTTAGDIQADFARETRSLMRGAADGYFGFRSQNFAFRRSPVTQRCYFAEFAEAVGLGAQQIAVADRNRFPGPGWILNGLNAERIFAHDPQSQHGHPLKIWMETILADLGPLPGCDLRGNIHPIKMLSSTRMAFLRGLRVFTVADNPFFNFHDEPMSWLDSNHHFDTAGMHMGHIVPTRAIWSFLDPWATNYNRNAKSRPAIRGANSRYASTDICDAPPTIQAIERRCEELGTRVGVIHVGSGSCFSGGLCNGLKPKSSPAHNWEIPIDRFFDNFGHAHKWHIHESQKRLKALWNAHLDIYEIGAMYQRIISLYKIADARYAWGLTHDQSGAELDRAETGKFSGQSEYSDGAAMGLGEEDDSELGSLSLQSASSGEDDLTAEFDAADPNQHWRLGTLRMLEWAKQLALEYRLSNTPKDQSYVLVLAKTAAWAQTPISPFIVDTSTGIIWRKGAKPLFFDRLDGPIPAKISEWWLQEVAPLAFSEQWLVPRLMPRADYLDQLRALGAKDL